MGEFFEEDDDPPEPDAVAALRPRPLPAPRPRGNVPRALARDARRAALAEAQGNGPREPDEWREDLAEGRRFRAETALRSREPTHNAGSGFGLADPNRELP